jgi:DNA-binding cell septation regulator SpoVG
MRQSEHRDIAHPITAECREMLQKKILAAYESEKGRAPSAGDSPRSDAASLEEDIE